ncbi:MAG: glycosyltransferase [Niabella sp.]
MNILFFGPFSYRARDNESLMIQFRKMGHQVFFLNMENNPEWSALLSDQGIHVQRLPGFINWGKFGWLKKIFSLKNHITRHKIDMVFSHLEPANFLSVLVQPFVKAKIILVRHHADLFYLNNWHRSFSYRFTYNNAKQVIAVSNYTKEVMVKKEGFNADKISVIPLSFNFNLFDEPSPERVKNIRSRINAELLLVSVGRLVPNKRLHLSIEVLKKLRDAGINAGLMILGEGVLEEELKNRIREYHLDAYCHLVGYKINVMDYLAACDILLHPSDSEASSLVIKEAGLQNKVIIACKNVGDCGEYIVNSDNGYLLDLDNYVKDAFNIIAASLLNRETRLTIGKHLCDTIYQLYDVNRNIIYYQKFIDEC